MNDALASNQDISRKEPIEVGWLLFSSEPNAPMEAAAEARGEVQTRLSNLFPEYNWVMPEARHVLHELDDAISPVQILERAERERDRHGWDFAIAITDLDLVSHLKSYAMGAPSRALGVCVLSLARLDERGAAARTSERSASTIRRRITALSLHLFGDLNGIEHATNPVNYMHPPDSVDDLDRMVEYGAGCTEQLRVALRAVAERFRQCLHFNRIADRRSCAVPFNETNAVCIYPCIFDGLGNCPVFTKQTRRGEAHLLPPVVDHGTALDDGINGIAILLRLDFSPAAALAFIIATGFVADTTSLPLVISNLVNIVSANYFDIGFGRYAAVMVPVNLVSLAATLAVLWIAFGRRIPKRYALAQLDMPRTAIRDPLVFRAAFPLLAVLLLAYFVTASFGIPISFVTGAAAFVLLAVAGRWFTRRRGVVPIGRVMRGAPWQIVLFSIGMYLVVYGLGNAGLTDAAAGVLNWLAQQGTLVATVGTGVTVAILASVMNNMPATLVGALAISQADVPAFTQELMVYANVVGNDLGPKFTPIGSLATLLWLHVLSQKGQRITWGQYMKVGLILTPPVLLATLLGLWAWLTFLADVGL